MQSPQGKKEEFTQLIDSVTTNKTDFFRESGHFTHLVQKILPGMTRAQPYNSRIKLNIWSAGCASGEEPYTLSMILSDFISSNPGIDFSILATDISTRVLSDAINATYPEEAVKPIPIKFKRKYLMKGTGSKAGYYRIVPEIRKYISFRWLNFLDNDFGINNPMDIIFCRNVIIYFDRKTQQGLINKFYNQLKPGGYLFLGHSETLNGIDSRFDSVAPTIYQKM
ncbi:MAG: chemotaxis protein CheR [Desulfobacterales bacterium]|nr:chemotaxis protein CheR [Desulfobacterales bacterium]MDD4391793.1 chemotaxis protein CheR [Desulfobacterales bacterium]